MFYNRIALVIFKFDSKYGITLFLSLFLGLGAFAQMEHENQFENEYQFNKVVGNKTAAQLDLVHTYTSGLEESNPIYKSSQISGRLWLHYYGINNWKISGYTAYIYNNDVPEFNKKETPEIRFSVQGLYYFTKNKYVLTNRFRIEDRILQDENESFDVVFRFRDMIKLVYPITVIKVGKGSLYGFASEEIVLKTKSTTTGQELFDRNRVTLGIGYSFSDAFQFELSYVNQYLPRATNDKMFNVIGTKLVFNDFISTLRKKNGTIPSYE